MRHGSDAPAAFQVFSRPPVRPWTKTVLGVSTAESVLAQGQKIEGQPDDGIGWVCGAVEQLDAGATPTMRFPGCPCWPPASFVGSCSF